MESFKLASKVIAGSGIAERCQNLDKRREKPYWTLLEEMLARAFEVYLKTKLEEQGIRNDYLVNYRSEESYGQRRLQMALKWTIHIHIRRRQR